MKPKKFVLKRETVSNLNFKDLDKIKGGARTYDSCGITNDCFTDYTCTVMPQCECTFACTLPCPVEP